MSAILIPTLHVMGGICAFAAVHHGLAALRRRVNRIHNLFALLCLAIMVLVLAKAGAYQAQTVPALVALRKLEISAVCVFFALLPWFIGEYTAVRPRKLLLGLSVFFAMIFAVNLSLPYGIQYVDLPRLTYFDLPWGERVVDLRVLQRSTGHQIGWLGMIAVMTYSVHACVVQYRRGQQRKARSLAWGLGLFFALILFNLAANLEIVRFVHLSDFGFIALLVKMDLEMMLESRDQRRRMRDVLDHLPAAVCLKDPQGGFQLVNRAFEQIFHVSDANITGKTGLDLLSREQAERFRADHFRAIETRQAVENEHVLEQDGRQRIYESHQYPMLRPDGTPYAVCGVYLDVTESRHRDAALQKFRRQVWHADRVASTSAITGSLAHELCQPLSAILNNSQAGLRFLEREQVDLDEMREIFEDIVRDDKRAGAVISGLRAMLQKQETPLALIDLSRSIAEMIELLHSEFIRQGVEVEPLLEANLTVRANKTQIQQVALNLMVNAMEAMVERPSGERLLRVRAVRADDRAQVSIRDSGVGITPDMLQRVFEGFYTTKPQGLGIGLEVCRSILETHRGAIWAEPNPDRGVTFHFTLPLAARSPADESAPGA